MPDWSFLVTGGFLLIILGSLLMLIAILGSAPTGSKEGNEKDIKVKGGGIVFIGPVPIIFGSDKRSAITIMLLAIVIMLLLIILIK